MSPLTDTILRELAKRVEKLEASNCRWKLVSAVLLFSAISMLLTGAKAADRSEPSIIRVNTIEARDIILKDESGNICARLSVLPIIDRLSGHMSIVMQSNTAERAVLKIYNVKGLPAWTAPPSPILVPAKWPKYLALTFTRQLGVVMVGQVPD